MKCAVCRHGKTVPSSTTVTLERDALTLVVKNVPAQVCDICGEEYMDEKTTDNLLRTAEAAARKGIEVEVQQYPVA